MEPDGQTTRLPSITLYNDKLTRRTVAENMTASEIHEDVHQFFAKLNEQIEG
jgi:uncharacterized membrane protein